MSAPVRTDPPTLPLPISRTLPRAGGWLMSPDSELLIAAVPLAAIGTGLLINTFVALTEEQQSNFAIAAIVFVLVFVVGGGFLFARLISRGGDGRS